MNPAPFEQLGASGSRDENGILSITIPHWCATIGEVVDVGGNNGPFGLPETGRSFSANEDGTFTVFVVYEGQANEGGEAAQPQGRENPVYQLNTSFEEEAIEAHPLINDLVEKYGGWWESDRAVWPPKMPEGKSANSGLGGGARGSAQGDGKPNPMCGVEKYKKLSVQWQVSYAAKEIPPDVINAVGRITGSPPGNPPSVAGRGKWLVMPPTAQKRGNVAEITENYLLLDADVAPEIYKETE